MRACRRACVCDCECDRVCKKKKEERDEISEEKLRDELPWAEPDLSLTQQRFIYIFLFAVFRCKMS